MERRDRDKRTIRWLAELAERLKNPDRVTLWPAGGKFVAHAGPFRLRAKDGTDWLFVGGLSEEHLARSRGAVAIGYPIGLIINPIQDEKDDCYLSGLLKCGAEVSAKYTGAYFVAGADGIVRSARNGITSRGELICDLN